MDVVVVQQMAVAIIAAMLFVVIDPVYKFLGEYAVWIVVTVGEPYLQHSCSCSKTCPRLLHHVQGLWYTRERKAVSLDFLGVFGRT